MPPEEVKLCLERCLYPCSITKDLEDIINQYDPDEHGLPIEGHWFEDAELPLRIVDGVPESVHHSLRRNCCHTPGVFYQYNEGTRDYLKDLAWYLGLNEEYERVKAEEMEK